jgi:MFS family permease
MNDQSDVPREYERIPRELLKHATGRYSHVILVPQPSDSPNDPLNWPTWRKDMILLIVGFVAAVVGAFGPMLSPGFLIIAADLDIKVSTLGQSTAWLILTIGLSLFIMNPLAKVWGRRPVFLISIAVMFACSVWGAYAKDYSSFLASRYAYFHTNLLFLFGSSDPEASPELPYPFVCVSRAWLVSS